MYMSHSQPKYAHPPLETKRRVCRDERERVVLAQLRCNGKSPIFQKYLYDIGASLCDACLQCGQSPDDLHHALYDCPEVDVFRSLIPGDPMVSFWESPLQMIEFLRASQRLPIA
ncbi:hypothetical protein ElyMa_000238300 [Elysia marginata]|uniref:Reverse transcriptase zinc-binding domain-containing protein n=1 Tax=Elysia marginata TaxID=1093978 RepID=A0AAV4F325_9GAST|nr:hypothetical protein ElyMa_000238300 [Elysia marginata]